MPIVIPPRGSKPQPASTVKRVPILPPKVGSQPAAQVANPTIITAKAEVDSSLFNRSVLPQSKTTPKLPIPIELTKVWTPQQTGITTTLEELLKIYPPPLRADGKEIVPYPWQHDDINALIGWDRVGVFLPVGAGKTLVLTYTALGWGAQVYIVVLLPILIPQWVKWLNAIPGAGPAVAYKGTPKQREELDLLKYRWWVMSYGIYKNDFNKLMKLLLKLDKYGVLVDEAHNIKNTESKNFKLISRMTAGQHIALATGTELNNPGDAYAYCKIKTPGVYRSYQQFMNIHVAKEDFFGKPLEWQHTDVMNRNLYLQSVQRTKEEVQKHLPRAKYMPLEYELEPAHAKLYKELAEQQILKLEDGGKIDATTQQTLWNHMQQIVLNWNQYAGRTDLRPAAFDVIDMLREQLDFDNMKTKRKFIIWTWYQQSTEVVRDYLEGLYPGRVAVAYGKSNSDKEFARFKDDPECWWMVAQPLSAGAGVEPQYVCYNCLFLETPTRTIPFRQAAGRLDRDGQSESANIWIGIAKGTIQETLYENLLNNDALVQQVQKNPRDIRKMIYGGA